MAGKKRRLTKQILKRGSQICQGGWDHHVRAVAVPRHLHADQLAEPDPMKRAQHAAHVHVAFPERQVDMDAALHVLDRDGAEARRELRNRRRRVALAGDDAVPGVEREPQPRDRQRRPVIDRLDQHAGLRFQRRGRAKRLGPPRHLLRPCAQPGPCVPGRNAGLGHAGPERHGVGAGFGRDLQRVEQELDPPRPPGWVGAQQGRLVLGARVQQETRPGFHHAAQA